MKASLLPRELADLAPDELFVSELFLSVQGESTHAGRPCFFVRLTGCHLRCVWCDTEYSFFDGRRMTVGHVLGEVERAGCDLVEVTGGEPLLQRAVHPLMTGLADAGYEVLLETSGAVAIDAVDPRVKRIVDWKTPGSGMERHNRRTVPDELRGGDELKLVVRDRADYEWAREWLRANRDRWPAEIPVHLSPSFGELSPRDLAEWILADALPVRLNLQLHKLVWDPDARGV